MWQRRVGIVYLRQQPELAGLCGRVEPSNGGIDTLFKWSDPPPNRAALTVAPRTIVHSRTSRSLSHNGHTFLFICLGGNEERTDGALGSR